MIQDRLVGSLVGLAVGDCVGAAVEFRSRDTFPEVTDMLGGGPFNLPVGYWTDDTSMALCLAESLIKYPYLDKKDLLSRFSDWYRHGYNSSTGRCFDIGTTTRSAIRNFEDTGAEINNTHFMDAGNGSIMRLAPAAIKWHNDLDRAVAIAVMQGETTHGSAECRDSCDLMTRVLIKAYNATSKEEVLDLEIKDYWEEKVKLIPATLDVVRNQVSSTGYVIHTLHAALWCFKNTDNFRDAILLATNLGDDTDTVAAVTGQIAGAYYGLEGIPQDWKDKLFDYQRIVDLANELTSNE